MSTVEALRRYTGEPEALLRDLAQRLSVPWPEYREFAELYNRDYSIYTNDIYRKIESRLVHLENFLSPRWFNHRLDTYVRLARSFDVVLDLGFSVPYLYCDQALWGAGKTRFVFVDRYESAAEFARAVDDHFGRRRFQEQDLYVTADLESGDGKSAVVQAISECRPSSLLIVASEIIEHVHAQDNFWATLSAVGEHVAGSTSLYVTVPVGERIPSHSLEFLTPESAIAYLRSRMELHWTATLRPRDESEPNNPYLSACVTGLGRPLDTNPGG